MYIYSSTRVLPYVYKLTHKTSGQFYFGYRCSNIEPSSEDLPKYQSSSKEIANLGFQNFYWEILAEFFDDESAYDFENFLIAQEIKNPQCLNKSYTKQGSRRFRLVGPATKERKYKTSKTLKGKPKSAQAIENFRKARTGKALSKYHREQISKHQTGKVRSEESKIKTSLALSNKPWSEARRNAESAKQRKTWIIEFEDGRLHVTTTNLKEWCEHNGFVFNTLIKTRYTRKFNKGAKVDLLG